MTRPDPAVRRWRRAVARPALCMGVGSVLLLVAPGGADAQTEDEPAAFSGSASAVGVNVNVTISGFPATDVPVDSGGPTAQALADSSGFQSTAYAAFPDPGEFALTAPGLVPGLVEGGVAGLPPIEFPSPPAYPFFVQTDPSNPSASIGSGAYALNAESDRIASRADAVVGIQQGANLATVRSFASVGPQDDGTVVAEAVTEYEGLRAGPLAVGTIRSLARQYIDEFGQLTSTTDLEISGLSIGGIAVNLTADGIDVLGVGVVPVPIGDTLQQLLGAAGMSIELLQAQEFEDRVVAPGVRITMPIDTPLIPNLGEYDGTAVLTIGQATASLLTGTSGPLDGFRPETPSTGGTTPSLGGVGSSTGSLGPSSGLGGSSGSALPPTSAGSGSAAAPSASAGSGAAAPAAGFQPAAAIRPEALLGIESVYLVLAAGALLTAFGGNLIQRLGGRAA